jgi:broad specificity phosphatase PhoE
MNANISTNFDIYKGNKQNYFSLKMFGGLGENDDKDHTKKDSTTSKEDSDIINVISVTHNARMRCLLEDILGDAMKLYRKQKKVKEIRFKNCCVLKISIEKNSPSARVELVYEGFVSKRKHGGYFVTPRSSTKTEEDVEFIIMPFDLNKLNIDYRTIKKNMNLYLIRHGEAEHNIKKVNLKKDTLLTNLPKKKDDGVRQAQRAGEELKKILNGEKISYTFCSELKRSRETLGIIMKKMELILPMIVLPYSNELAFVEGGNCDNKQPTYTKIKTPQENVETCSDKLDDPKAFLCKKVGDYTVIWGYWIHYKNLEKTNKGLKLNMIKIITEIVQIESR